jgi:hypothetical protein
MSAWLDLAKLLSAVIGVTALTSALIYGRIEYRRNRAPAERHRQAKG